MIQAYAGEARWYERVRRALCGETGHVLDQRWRVPSLPLREGDFIVQTASDDQIGRVAGIFQGPGNNYARHDEENGEWGPVSIEWWYMTAHEGYLKKPGEPVRVSQQWCAWVEGHAWSVGENTDGMYSNRSINVTRFGTHGKKRGTQTKATPATKSTKKIKARRNHPRNSRHTGHQTVHATRQRGTAVRSRGLPRWSMGPRGWIRRVKRGALQNGGVYGNEANQSSTGEAAGLLEQLQMQVDDSVAHKHTQQIDCKGVLNTYAKVDDFREKDWVVQADRREWLKIAELKRRLRARPGASFHTRWVHSHVGNWEEAVADRRAKRGAKM